MNYYCPISQPDFRYYLHLTRKTHLYFNIAALIIMYIAKRMPEGTFSRAWLLKKGESGTNKPGSVSRSKSGITVIPLGCGLLHSSSELELLHQVAFTILATHVARSRVAWAARQDASPGLTFLPTEVGIVWSLCTLAYTVPFGTIRFLLGTTTFLRPSEGCPDFPPCEV